MTAKVFWRSTIPEILAAINGYQNRLYHEFSMNRSLRYSLYCLTAKNPIDIWDWEPLDGDPTKEERDKAKKIADQKASEDYMITRAYYKSIGVDVM